MAPNCRCNGHARCCFALFWREHKCSPPLPQVLQLNFPHLGKLQEVHTYSVQWVSLHEHGIPLPGKYCIICYRNSLNSHRQSKDLKPPKLGVNELTGAVTEAPELSSAACADGMLPAINGLNGQLGMRPKSLMIQVIGHGGGLAASALRTEPQRFPQGPDSWHGWAARRCQ